MTAKKRTMQYGVAAVVIAIVIVAAAMVIGPATNLTTMSQSQTLSGQTGVLAAQMTDPPNAPAGVTNIYISYSDVKAHVADAGNLSGWYTVANGSQVDLMSLVNVSVTVGSAPVKTGEFDLVRFDILNATVTYNGKNYSAYVPSNEMTVPIEGGVSVQAGSSSGLLIDLSPTVVPYANGTGIGFVLIPAAKSLQIPSQAWHSDDDRKGTRSNLASESWWKESENHMRGSLAIENATLTPNGLTIVVKNTGSSNVTLTAMSILTNNSVFGSSFVGHEGDNETANSTSTTTSETTSSNSAQTHSSNGALGLAESNTTDSTTRTSTTNSSIGEGSATNVTETQHTSVTETLSDNSTTVVGTHDDRSNQSTSSSEDSRGFGDYHEFHTVAAFQILSNGTLIQPAHGFDSEDRLSGYVLQPNQTLTLTFKGPILTLHQDDSEGSASSLSSILSGQQYIISIIAQFGIEASANVTATA